MQKVGATLNLSAGDLVGHLNCRYLTELDLKVADGELDKPKVWDPVLEALVERGALHEQGFIEHLRAADLAVTVINGVGIDANSVAATRDAMARGDPVIVQSALQAGKWNGRADVLRRVETPSRFGAWSYEVIDTKLARETKGNTVLQISLYSDLLSAAQELEPQSAFVVTPGTNYTPEEYRIADYAAYYRHVRSSLERSVSGSIVLDVYPEPIEHCEICRWRRHCDARRRADDHMSLVAGISKSQIGELERHGIASTAALAVLPLPLLWRPERGAAKSFEKVREQARIQVEGRTSGTVASDRFVGHLIGRSWVLQERAAGTFEFTHRTFMEYYFALWLHDFYDGIQLLFDFVAPRIRAGEWTVPIHLAFQMKSAGKLRSAEALTGALIKLLEQTHSSDLQWKEADSAKQRELKSAGFIAKNYPEVPKVLQFIVGSIGYLQPSEASLARLTRALTHSVSNKNEWFSVVGGLVASPTEFQASIAEGVYQSLADDIAGRKGYSVGYVVDWLYACYLSGRTRHSVSFPTHVLRFSDVRKRFGERFLSRIQEGRGSTSLPKITFDLTGSTIASVADAGLAMWSASIVPDRRIDWRFVDFGLGLMESIDVLLGQATAAECPYVAFFATLAGVVPQQRDYPISGGLGVLASFDCGGARDVAGRLQTCELEVALSFAVSIIGFTDMSLRLKISPSSADDVETIKRAEQLGMCPSLRKSEADDVLHAFLGREDVPDDFRDYVRGWIDGEFSMFRPSVRTEYVNHRQAFSGLKEAS